MPQDEFDPLPGRPEPLEPGLRRILAPNPSPMTFRGTNTYLIGDRAVTVIDPGPDLPVHLAAILSALGPNDRITDILVTHAHLDHSGLAPGLARATGATIHAFGTAMDGRSPVMRSLAASGLGGGGEGLDRGFAPDRRLSDGDRIGDLTAIRSPGHAANHMCFSWNGAVFSGDTIMGWASTLVSPPDGDLTAFMATTERLASLDARVFFPGHGAPIPDPTARCLWLRDHRRARETQILAAIPGPGAKPPEITRIVYTETPPGLLLAAERNVFAHLVDLPNHRLTAHPTLAADATFRHR